MLKKFAVILLAVLPAYAWPDVKTDIRSYVEGIQAGWPTAMAGEVLRSPTQLVRFYVDRDYRPLWTEGGPLASRYGALMTALADSENHGFQPNHYHLRVLPPTDQRGSISALALELLATDAFLTQTKHRSSGVISPRQLDPDWHLVPPEVDAVKLLADLAESAGDPATALASQWPQHDEYLALVAERARIVMLGETTAVEVPSGSLLKPGHSGDRVLLLKERLLGPGEYTAAYDEDLLVAVKAFQMAAGLEPDGIIGEATLEVLNATQISWLDRIDANLERWRWLPKVLPETLVRVNIAAFQLRAIRNGKDEQKMDVIVGRPYRKTPVFTETMKYLVLNPYWNVPFSLATKDKLPILQSDPGSLQRLGYEARSASNEEFVPVTRIDWASVTHKNFSYQLRQRPGPDNALGQIKFMLPNPFSVYLHDSNDRTLFKKRERGFSSGCIRIAEPVSLAHWLLQNENRQSEAAEIENQIASGQTSTVHLRNPVPVYIVYFTAFVDGDGDVRYRRDLYQRDRPILDAIRAGT